MHFCRIRRFHQDINITLNDALIQSPSQAKYFSLTLDETLSWKPYFLEIKKSCIHHLTLMRKLSKTTYGADTTFFLRFYRSLIKLILDYRVDTYSSTAKKTLKLPDTFHHSALRIVTDSFRKTLCTSLYALCNELPPNQHCKFKIFLDRTHVSLDNPIDANKPYGRSALANRYLASLESIGMNHQNLKLSSEKIAEE